MTDKPEYAADPATQAVLDKMAAAKAPSYATLTPDEARAAMLAAGNVADMETPHVASVVDREIPTRGGSIKIRIYEPSPEQAAAGPRACTLYFHGGGFVIGDLDTHDNIARSLARGADCMVIAVDYRLAPEYRYPAPVEDAIDAWRWVRANADEINVDHTRLAVAGDSAGGTLAAILTQTGREEGYPFKAQVLFYPLVDMTTRYPSHEAFKSMPPVSEDVLDYFWGHYLTEAAKGELESIWLSPIRAERFSDLPPAFVMTAGLDPLRDEGAAYAAKLSAAGVETQYMCVTGTVHAFLRMGKFIPATFDVLDAATTFLKRRL